MAFLVTRTRKHLPQDYDALSVDHVRAVIVTSHHFDRPLTVKESCHFSFVTGVKEHLYVCLCRFDNMIGRVVSSQ